MHSKSKHKKRNALISILAASVTALIIGVVGGHFAYAEDSDETQMTGTPELSEEVETDEYGYALPKSIIVSAENREDVEAITSSLETTDITEIADSTYVVTYDSADEAETGTDFVEEANNLEAVENTHLAVVNIASESDTETKVNLSEDIPEGMTLKELAEEREQKLVAVIDTGVNGYAIQSVDFTNTSAEDNYGHGTRIARTIYENSDGKAMILSLKAVNDEGSGYVSDVMKAVRYAIDQKVDIINLSIITDKTAATQPLESLILEAINSGITVVSAAGNYSSNVDNYIAAGIPEVITVGSITEDRVKFSASNYGENVDYWEESPFTSVAAAKVVAKLVKEDKPNLFITNDDITINPEDIAKEDVVIGDTFKTQSGSNYLNFEFSGVGTVVSSGYYTSYSGSSTGGTVTVNSSGQFDSITVPNASYCSSTTWSISGYGNVGNGSFNPNGKTFSFRAADNWGAYTGMRWYITCSKASGTYWSHTVSFNANGGSVSPTSKTKTYGSHFYVPTPTRTGYTFTGWKSNISGDTNLYTCTSSTSGGTEYTHDQNGGTVTLTAQWTVNKYNVAYNANGGSSTPSTQSGNYGSSITLASAISRSTATNATYTVTYNANGGSCSTSTATSAKTTKYTFSKWALNSTSGTTYSAGASFTIPASNSTMYATWSSSTSTSAVTLPTPTRTGYTFNGWYTASSGGTKVGAAGASYTPSASVTLYAQWTAKTYTVTYNANGGSGSMSTSTATYNSAFTTRQNAFTRTGYTFNGWNEKADGSGTAWTLTSSGVYEAGKSWTWTYTSNITLYAQWKINSYTLTINPNGGSYKGSTSNSTIIQNYGTKAEINAIPTRTGYTFVGWKRSGSGSLHSGNASALNTIVQTEKADSDGTAYTNYSLNYTNSGTGNVWPYFRLFYYPYTSGHTYRIEFDTRVNSVSGLGYAQVRHSAFANNWEANSTSLNSITNGWVHKTLERTFTGTTVTQNGTATTINPVIEFYCQISSGITGSFDFDLKNVAVYDITAGSYVTSNTSNVKNCATVDIGAGDTTLTAVWSANKYNVTVHPNNGSLNVTDSSITKNSDGSATFTVTYGSTNYYALGISASRTGYTANGIYTATSGGTKLWNNGGSCLQDGTYWNSSNQWKYTGNVDLYIQWAANNYSIYYSLNGGTNGSNAPTSGTYDSVLNISNPTRSGYTFTGWTFDGNTSTAYHGSSSSTVTTLWNSTSTKTSDQYFKNLTPTAGATVTLTAHFEKTVTATFKYYNDASTTVSGKLVDSATSVSITAPSELGTPSGYSFRGWSTSSAGNASIGAAAGASVSISANTTYYGSYQKTITATFYYSTLTANQWIYNNGAQTSTTATAPQYINYVGSVTNGTFTVPTAVADSTGGETAINYAGVSKDTNSATTITPTTAYTTYYAVYTEPLKFYYYNGTGHTSTDLTRRMLSNGSAYNNSLSSTEPTPSAYDGAIFSHWSTTSSSYSADNKRTPLGTGVNSLFAVYNKTITVAYNANNGSGAPSSQTGTKYYISKSDGANTYSPSITLSSTKPTRTGYTFASWNSASGGTGTSYSAETAYSFSANTTLYAQWTINQYTVAYNANGGSSTPSTQTANYGSSVALASAINRNNATTDYTVTYNYNGSGASNTTDTATKTTKYAFNKWALNSTSGTTYAAGASYTIPAANSTMYATWTSSSSTASVILPTPTRTGYTFAGWYTAATDGTQVGEGGASYTPTGNVTLYAHWTINSYYLDLNGYLDGVSSGNIINYGTADVYVNGTLVADDVSDYYKQITYGSTYEIKDIKAKTGHTYNGVYSGAVTGTMGTSRISVVLNFTTNNYSVSYHANGGFGSMSASTVTYGKNFITSKNILNKPGYAFSGWNEKADGSGTAWTLASAGVYESGTSKIWTSASNITLYAQWTPIKYTIDYTLNGGSLASPVTTYYANTEAFSVANPTRTAYKFTTWNESISTSNWTEGFINLSTGAFEESYSGWPNAVYSEAIFLKSGVTYKLTGTSLGGIRWRFFATDGTYIGSTSDATFTPTSDGYAYILLFEGCTEENRNAAKITSIQSGPLAIPKGSTGNRSYSANWELAESFQWSVPAELTYTGQNQTQTLTVKVTENTLAEGNKLKISLKSGGTVTEAASGDSSNLTIKKGSATISAGSQICEYSSGSTGSTELSVTTESTKYSGKYQGTLSFASTVGQ